MQFRPGHILVADHQGHLDDFVCKVLNQDSSLIEHLENFHDLIDKLERTSPDVIILNAKFPDLDMDRLHDRVIHLERTTAPRIILAVNGEHMKFLNQEIIAKVHDVLIAPFNGTDLLTKIYAATKIQSPPVRAKLPLVGSTCKKMTLLLLRADTSAGALFEPSFVRKEIKKFGARFISAHEQTLVFAFSNSAMVADHRISALQAAFHMQVLALLHESSPRISCVLHSGSMVQSKHRGGGEDTNIGSALALALLLLEACKPGEVLASAECYQEIMNRVSIVNERTHILSEGVAKGVRFATVSALNAPEFVLSGMRVFGG